MIETILPSGVEATEAFADDHEATFAHDTFSAHELQCLGPAAPGRRREFATGRRCARSALQKLGAPLISLPSGRHREPLWPEGVVGSVTHCAGYRAAAVAKRESFLAIGIDAELHRSLPPGVLGKVALLPEQHFIDLRAGRGVFWDSVLFSAKESVFKAWFPLTYRRLGFEDAVISLDPSAGLFRAEILIAPARVGGLELASFCGRFAIRDGLVLTFVGVPVCGGVA